MDLEEYDMEGERATSITSLETDLNTRYINKIGMDMLYQADITHYIKRSI